MFASLPPQRNELIEWSWAQFEPYYQDLTARPLNAENVTQWLADWSAIAACADEYFNRLMIRVNANTADTEAENRYNAFFQEIYPHLMQAEQNLREKLIQTGLEPEGFTIPLRNMRSTTALFRAENLPLEAEENKVRTEYDKTIGAQTVLWQGEERTLAQMGPLLQSEDRSARERAWRAISDRQLADREAINVIWQTLLELRLKIASNADYPDYRAFRWQEMQRFDYTPENARQFQNAIEEVVVPAARRVLERRKQRLGIDQLRPWDLDVDTSGQPALHPFDDIDSFTQPVSQIFHQVDPVLGGYFDEMRREKLLDLENRKNKAPGGYCTSLAIHRKPFIFMNAVGVHDNVQTLLHEGGHAFHVFESARLPYIQQMNVPMEFAEVASMSMELLSQPYLTKELGGFYTQAEAARARIEHLEGLLLFWPYMAVVDAFQHWAYENPQAAADSTQCDAAWDALWQRFMPVVDWSGLEDARMTGWHRKLHIYNYPFYYIEYGLAQLGAVQVWRNSLQDAPKAVANYRHALGLGGTVTLPELFQAAGARFAFDAPTLREAVNLVEEQLGKLYRL